MDSAEAKLKTIIIVNLGKSIAQYKNNNRFKISLNRLLNITIILINYIIK